MDPYNSQNIPIIQFTPAELDPNFTDDKKIKLELNNNTEKQDFVSSEENQTVKIANSDRKDKTIAERISDLGYCIRWITEELVRVIIKCDFLE